MDTAPATGPLTDPDGGPTVAVDASSRPGAGPEDGSMVSEYGLVAVLGATIVGLAISWANGGAVAALLDAVLAQLRGVVGA